MTSIAWAVVACLLRSDERVFVEQESRGCFHHDQKQHEWKRDGARFTWNDRSLSREEVVELRDAIVAARQEVPELLAEVGVTEAALRAHRDDIVAAALPAAFAKLRAEDQRVASRIDALLAWDRVAPLLRKELLGQWWSSTSSQRVRVTFELDGRKVVAESSGLMPWMLPWQITVAGDSFQSEDLAVPRAVLKLLDPTGPCVASIDGTAYWRDKIWTNRQFWGRFVGDELEEALSSDEYSQLPGWDRASARFRVRDVSTGMINLQPESMFFTLDAKAPAVIDSVRWHDFLVDDQPAQSWDDFLALYDAAEACVAKQSWMLAWNELDPDRHLQLEAAGTSGIAESMVEELVMPAWEHAGLPGRPEFEILLRNAKGVAVGTVYLSSRTSSALIDSANPDRGLAKHFGIGARKQEIPTQPPPHHWFDDLEFSYHPRGDPPTYAVVDAEGKVQVRTMPQATRRRR